MKVAVLIVAALLAASPAAGTDWVRVETRNFIVYGETGEARVREVAAEFERFREALARVIPAVARPAAVPTVVVVFGSARAFAPYRPRFNGKPIKAGGYFYSSDDMNLVALEDGDRAESLRTIFHEYVHLAIANIMPEMPLWLNEGLAEFYSTFAVDEDGRRAILGRVIVPHLLLLNQKRPMTLQEMLAVDQQSPAYNEGERQTLFYAQSWALVHMLMAGTTNRSTELFEYANLVAQGTPSPAAWQQVFGEENLIRQMGRYVGQSTMKAVLYRFANDIPRIKGDTAAVSAGDAEAALADLLRRVAPAEETAARFEKAVSLEPRSARAVALFGLHALDHGDQEKARSLLMHAVADDADWLVQYHVATGLTRLTAAGRRDAAEIDRARRALARVFAARPELPNALVFRARLDSMDAANLPRALDDIRRARELAPGREDYVLLEAFILMRRGEYTAAKMLLGPLLSTVYSASVRENARNVMGQIAKLELDAANYLARLEGRAPRSGETPAPSAPAQKVTGYRAVEAGETRAEGDLERIECVRSGVVFHLRVGGAIEQFNARNLSGVELISYRADLRGGIACASRTPPDAVYLTWRPDGDTRRAVAVEFLPTTKK
jgi:tetratricopeptide (TPR) repeat protein